MKIAVWGRGYVGKELLETELKDVKIDFFIDNSTNIDPEYEVITPERAVKRDYDAVVVATGYSREIYEQALDIGFDMSKFIFIYNNYILEDMNINYELASEIFSPEYISIIKNRYHVIRGMMKDEIGTPVFGGYHSGMYHDDYNRLRTFQLVVEEIEANNIDGAVAELGVFRGEFAKYINKAFPTRKCYLFDTFEGFRKNEAQNEKNEGNCGDAFIEHFRNTTKDLVMSMMPYPDKIICKQGFFPESLHGLEDVFAFVSIDVDFEQSIYEGISYFYPRLNSGGYIFIHDYNSSTLRGVRRAISKYEDNYNVKMAKVPIPDICGSLVITK